MKYISKWLSMDLNDSWCHLETSHCRVGHWWWRSIVRKSDILEWYKVLWPAYDILNDICVKYADNFFKVDDYSLWTQSVHEIVTTIFNYIKLGKVELAEDYIWRHCTFNPKNKND